MLAVTNAVGAALGKGCDAWHLRLDKLSFERGGDASAKTLALKKVRDCYAQRSVGHLASVCRSRARFLSALKNQHRSRFATVELVLESKLLLHLGRASVLENVGLYFERTTGLPLIPGTSLKGLLSTWACWEGNQKGDGSFNDVEGFVQQRNELGGLSQRVFGDDSKAGSEHAGEVIFLGGFPMTPPRLGIDIVNPHYDPHGHAKLNLTPNAFLCAEPDTKWIFAFYVRAGAANAADLIQATSGWLTQALCQVGIGAKTAAGYGRFRLPNQSDLAAAAAEAEKARSVEKATEEKAKLAAEKTRQQTEAQKILHADYSEASFKNLLRLAENKGDWVQLKAEMERLRKAENAAWLQKFKDLTTGKDWKDLRKQPWYPQ
ncbi:hypothetical protein SBV1_3410002 [Verrucomicrobia bacterium]|nr:hypothetical protein SBV1_3410002 [Verrucomicrobiota bacterium]